MFLKNRYEIEQWLYEYKIENFTINDDLTVDVMGRVNLFRNSLVIVPVKFNIVTGDFSCTYNEITTLEFAPKEVGGSFFCHKNCLTTFRGLPEKINNHFLCFSNPITTLEGAPKNKLKEIIETYPHLTHTVSTEDLLEII
jgi:hypothetical protein